MHKDNNPGGPVVHSMTVQHLKHQNTSLSSKASSQINTISFQEYYSNIIKNIQEKSKQTCLVTMDIKFFQMNIPILQQQNSS